MCFRKPVKHPQNPVRPIKITVDVHENKVPGLAKHTKVLGAGTTRVMRFYRGPWNPSTVGTHFIFKAYTVVWLLTDELKSVGI